MITKRGRRWPALAMLLVLGAASACGGSGSAGDGSAGIRNPEQRQSDERNAAPEAGEAPDGRTDSGSDSDSEPGSGDQESSNRSRTTVDQRSIIRTGSMSVRTKQPERAADRAEELTADTEGFVGERTKRSFPGGAKTRVTLTLRVPVDQFDDARKAISKLGKVTEDRHEATDVTEEVVDVETRIEDQKRSIDRLRRLMAEANDVGEIIQIESELQTRESDLGSLQARQESLSSQTSLSTLKATFVELSPKRDDDSDENQFGFLTGLRGGTDALLATGTVALTAIGAVAPFLPLLLLFGAGTWWLRRWLVARGIRRQPGEPRVGA